MKKLMMVILAFAVLCCNVAVFNLNGQFSKMKFTLGHVDGESGTVKSYAQNRFADSG